MKHVRTMRSNQFKAYAHTLQCCVEVKQQLYLVLIENLTVVNYEFALSTQKVERN